jgi:twinkle protein
MKYYGSTDPEELFATLDYAVYQHDIAHIILDNLQFMLSMQRNGVDKFDLQD